MSFSVRFIQNLSHRFPLEVVTAGAPGTVLAQGKTACSLLAEQCAESYKYRILTE